MCGIAGIAFSDSDRADIGHLARKQAASIAHRGPDTEGSWSGAGVAFAHRRLSIIDLATGTQPLGNEDGSIQVVFNGEIYNYRGLQDWLRGQGHRFRTDSDTEVLVHLYEELGERLVERLRGMFAFAIWDERQETLLLARDRIGLKPLYYYRDDEKLLFGSEIKAILAHPDVERTIDFEALESYLLYGFIPGGQSIFRKIRKLPPAHTLCVSRGDWNAKPKPYWQLKGRTDGARNLEVWSEAVDAKLRETVVAHQIADVPVGAFLSGGLDSSAMVCLQSQIRSDRVKTFSIGFREEQFSEISYARQVAQQFETEHCEEIVTADAAEALADLTFYFDEPFADPSAIPTLHLARLARQYVKVVISGDGGDEAFGGYTRYSHDLREAAWRGRLPAWMRRSLLRPLAARWPKADWLPRPLRMKTALANLSEDADAAYANTVSLCRLPLRRELLSADARSKLNGHVPEALVREAFCRADANDPLAGMLAADIAVLLPDDFLTKVDRASMACGLEVRPPLVDHELLELTATMPSNLKVRGRETKWLLKRLFRSRLPAGVVDRPKQGFEIPIDDWLRGPLRPVFEATVFGPHNPVSEWLDLAVVRTLYQRHLRRVGRHGQVLWAILVLAAWAERWLGQDPARGHVAERGLIVKC